MKHDRCIQYLNRVVCIFFVIVVICAIYIMRNDVGLIDGLDFGPGSYYYSDIPNWESRFFTNEITLNTNYPLLFFIFFIGWGYISFKAWMFLDKKWK